MVDGTVAATEAASARDAYLEAGVPPLVVVVSWLGRPRIPRKIELKNPPVGIKGTVH